MYKRYGIASLTVTAIAVVAVNIVAWYGLEPYTNDLTRIGGFPEEVYGWHGTRESFPNPKPAYVNSGSYNEAADIVVLGDSFSHKPRSNWTYHLANITGFDIQVMHLRNGGIERIVNSELFQDQPPKVVIYQLVERSLYVNFHASPPDCKVVRTNVPLPSDFAPLGILTEEYVRDTKPERGNYQRAVQYIRTRLRLLRGDSSDLMARYTPLLSDDLFSNSKSDSLLFFANDLLKQGWPKEINRKVACGLSNLKQAVEANGKTTFVVMLVPDKLSAYSPWLKDKSIASLTVLDSPELAGFPNIVELHSRIINEIDRGFVDFYTPSDTHWSSMGDRKVAEWTAEFFQEKE